MKTGRTALFAIAVSLVSLAAAPAMADDLIADYQIANVTARPDFAGATQGVTFYFGNAPHPSARRVEQNVTTSLRTRRFGRSYEESCQQVMLSALIQLRDRALAVGGNAVVNVRSNWENVETSSTETYRCGAGFLMAGVALKADVVALR